MEQNTLQLSGFNAVERLDATVAETKFADKFKRHTGSFDELQVTKKDVHAQGVHAALEVNASLAVGGKHYHGHAEGHSLKEVLDGALGAIEVATARKA